MGDTIQRKIKILQICAIDETLKSLLLPLIDRLAHEGFDVTTCCSSGRNSDKLRDMGYDIENIEIARGINLKSNTHSVINLYKLIKARKFDIVHVHTPVAALLGRIAARLAGTPVIIYTAHGFYFHERMQRIKYRILVSIEKFAGRLLTDYIFTQSEEDRQTAINEKIIDEKCICTISNGVDVSNKFNPGNISIDEVTRKRKELNIGVNDKVIMFVGRLVKEKGIIELLEAFKGLENKNYKLLLVGGLLSSERDKETYDYISRIVSENSSIIMAGSRSDINDVLYMSNLFVLPSYREGMPRSIIEAMAMGKPVIATNIRGCREEVVDGETGYLVEVGNSEQIKNKIIEILENLELERSMGIKARQRAEELFDEDIVLDRQIEVIRELEKDKLPL